MIDQGKTLGILGGLGPMSSVYFYEMLTLHTKAERDQDHLNIILSSRADTPDRTSFILGKSNDDPVYTMKSELAKLVGAGADIVAIPCNTAHYFIEDISKNSNAKIINMVDSTLSYVKKVNGELACVLSTIGTAKTGVYNKYEKEGLEIFYPDECFASDIHEIIYKIKNVNTDLNEMAIKLKNIMDKIANQHEKPITFILALSM